MKKRDFGIDLIRAVSVLGIVLHHYTGELYLAHADLPVYIGLNYIEGSFGWLFSTLFFVISGMALFINYPVIKKEDIITFYKKRCLAIFPAFYVVWIFLYVERVLESGAFLYNGKPIDLLWSVFGLDGYVGSAYYLIGEWFIGIILLMYIMYPLVIYLNRNIPLITSAIIVVLFLVENYHYCGIQTGPFRGVFSSLLSFYIGICLAKYRNSLVNKKLMIVSIIVSALQFIVPVGTIDRNILVHFLGLTLTVAIYNVGQYLTCVFALNRLVTYIARLSYCIFLVHHPLVSKVVGLMLSGPISMKKYVLNFILILAWIVVVAWGLDRIVGKPGRKKQMESIKNEKNQCARFECNN